MPLCERIIALVFAFGLLVAGALTANAQSYETALAGFTKDSFNDTDAAIGAVAASGNPLAVQVVEALQDGRLLFGGDKVFIRDKGGAILDAATGKQAADAPTDLKPVRLKNRLRRSVEAALGGLTLMSADVGKRYEAAQAVFKSRDTNALPTLDTALAKETDTRVKRALSEARAAVILYQPGAAENDKIAAITLIKDRADQDARGLLAGLPSGQSATVQKAATDAITSIDNRLALWNTVQNAWYGLSLGSVLLLAAIGLAITFGVMGVINMAHGEMVMLGAYVTFMVQELIRLNMPGLFDYSLFIAIPLAFVVAGCVGIVIERGIIRFLYGRPLETLLATWGVSLILQQTVRSIFGANNREVGAPSYMAGAFDFYGLTITYGRLWIVVFAMAVFAFLLFVLKATSFGLKMRAVTQNRRMASCMGIRTPWLDS